MNSYWILWYFCNLGPSMPMEHPLLPEHSEIRAEKPTNITKNAGAAILPNGNPRQNGRPSKRRSKSRQLDQTVCVADGLIGTKADQSYQASRTPKHQQRGRGKWQ